MDTSKVPPPPPLSNDHEFDEDQATTRLPGRTAWLVAGTLIAVIVAFGIGRSGANEARAAAERTETQRASAERTREGLQSEVATLDSQLGAADRDATARASEISSLETELTELEGNLAETRSELEQARADVEAADERAETADVKAEEAARKAVDEENAKRSGELDARSARLDDRKQQLDQREDGLDDRAAALGEAESEAERNTFGDGTWEVGVDIKPGKYKSAGGSPCYWAKLEINTNDIIDNEIGDGPKTVVIEDGILFESNRCADWRRAD